MIKPCLCGVVSSKLLLCVVLLSLSSTAEEIIGFSVKSVDPPSCFTIENDVSKFSACKSVTLRLFGSKLINTTAIAFTGTSASEGFDCVKLGHSEVLSVTTIETGLSEVTLDANYLDSSLSDDGKNFFCVSSSLANGGQALRHQGDDISFIIYVPFELPIYIKIMMVLILLCMSALFSGLNLGLMALDVTELRLIQTCGNDTEKKLAKVIEPIRSRGNMLLVTLLLGNTLVNSTLTILLDSLLSAGLWAILGSTAGILIFGEIIPQSICSRYGLKVGYYTRFFTLFFMYTLFPLVYCMGKLLDAILGREIPTAFDRKKLREIVRLQRDDQKADNNMLSDEAQIIIGAIDSGQKPIETIMQKKADIFMVAIEQTIDYEFVEMIFKRGFTRIPVYANGDKDDIRGILNAKDILGIDPDDKLPLNSVVEFYNKQRTVMKVDKSTTILNMLKEFQNSRTHLALVVETTDGDDSKDPGEELVGIVTLEDVIESILDFDFKDETDADRDGKQGDEPRSLFAKQDSVIPLQLCRATVQFLIANVPSFKDKSAIDYRVLEQVLRLPEVFFIRKLNEKPEDNYLYTKDEHCDYFILIIQGACNVTIGQEQLPFEAGPYHYFGVAALPTASSKRFSSDTATDLAFKPDFSVQMASELSFIRLKARHWNIAFDLTKLCQTNNNFEPAYVQISLEKLRRKSGSFKAASSAFRGGGGDSDSVVTATATFGSGNIGRRGRILSESSQLSLRRPLKPSKERRPSVATPAVASISSNANLPLRHSTGAVKANLTRLLTIAAPKPPKQRDGRDSPTKDRIRVLSLSGSGPLAKLKNQQPLSSSLGRLNVKSPKISLSTATCLGYASEMGDMGYQSTDTNLEVRDGNIFGFDDACNGDNMEMMNTANSDEKVRLLGGRDRSKTEFHPGSRFASRHRHASGGDTTDEDDFHSPV